MLCRDVMNVIEKEYPLNYALSWDNVGLLVGRDDKEVKKIYIALDATDNYDVLGMAELSGDKMNMKDAEILEVTAEGDIGEEDEPEGIGRVSDLEIPMTLRECCEDVKDAFHLGTVKVFGNLEDKVKRIAICPGSGKSVIQAALDKHADVLITGDIGHHEGIDAVAQGLAIIDGGHYGIEHIFIEDMRQYLEKNLKDVEVIAAPIIHPFLLV